MKKLHLILAVGLLAWLCGCGSKGALRLPNPPPPTSPTSQQ
ncbi:MAG: LPS translocon maturation chaperone LptM [Thiobacillaceae bacterium]